MFYTQKNITKILILTTFFQVASLIAQTADNQLETNQTTTQTEVMVVFNADQFYVHDNSLAVQNGNTIVIKNKTVVDTQNQSIVTLSETNKQNPSPLSRLNIKPKKSFVSKQKVKEKPQPQPTMLSLGNSPFGNNMFFAKLNNLVAVFPTTNPKTKVLYFQLQNAYLTLNKLLLNIPKKESNFIFKNCFVPSDYSNTSRIRPPPLA
jgi:glycogen debranching enzyme